MWACMLFTCIVASSGFSGEAEKLLIEWLGEVYSRKCCSVTRGLGERGRLNGLLEREGEGDRLYPL